MGRFDYEDKRLAGIQDKIARALYYESCCGNVTTLWYVQDRESMGAPDFPLVSEGTRAFWRLMAYRAIEVMREEVGDK
jgi:hypothetical protein